MVGGRSIEPFRRLLAHSIRCGLRKQARTFSRPLRLLLGSLPLAVRTEKLSGRLGGRWPFAKLASHGSDPGCNLIGGAGCSTNLGRFFSGGSFQGQNSAKRMN